MIVMSSDLTADRLLSQVTVTYRTHTHKYTLSLAWRSTEFRPKSFSSSSENHVMEREKESTT